MKRERRNELRSSNEKGHSKKRNNLTVVNSRALVTNPQWAIRVFGNLKNSLDVDGGEVNFWCLNVTAIKVCHFHVSKVPQKSMVQK